MTDSSDRASENLGRELNELPHSEKVRAVVTGLVHPNRLPWSFENTIPFRIDGAECDLSIRDGQFNILVNMDWPDDPQTFLNQLDAIVQGCLDSLGFHLATPLRGEILSMSIEGRALVYRGTQWLELIPEQSGMQVDSDKLQPFTLASIEEPLIRLALADLRAAQESPIDTVMLCFRAIESVRQWFVRGENDKGAARAQSWDDMREKLGVEREPINALLDLAQSRRHGGDRAVSHEDRVNALNLARDIVKRLVIYRASNPRQA